MARLIVLVVAAAVLVLWLVFLIEALRTPEQQWKDAGQNQMMSIVLMVFLGIIGTIVYLILARPRLRRAAPSGGTA